MNKGKLTVGTLYQANLNTSSPRYKDWRFIMGSDEVPLQSPRSFQMQLPPAMGSVAPQSCSAYKLALDKFDANQKKRLIEWIGNKYGAPMSAILHQLDTQGFPIRGEDVIVAFSIRGFM